MFRRRLPPIILFMAFAHTAFASTPQPVEWSFLYLSRAANFLMVAADAESGSGQWCNLSSKDALALNPHIHALLDEKKRKILSAPLGEKILEQMNRCQGNCTCGYFMDLLQEKNSPMLKNLSAKAESLTSGARQICAQSFKNFCQSHLLKYLQNQSKENQ